MSQPSVLLVSYHFHPSNEIGARRPTALARFLVDKGLRVTVVSAFADHDIAPGSEVLPGVTAVPVRRPSRTFSRTVVHFKRKLRREQSDAEAQERSNRASGSASESRTSLRARTRARIRELYFRVAYFMDDYKCWGVRARRAAVREGKRQPPSLVLSSSPPLSVLWVGTLVARRLRVPHIADLRDPWSDVVADLHPAWVLDLALQRRIERWMMHSAAAITSTTAHVARLLIGRQPELASKTFIVRNGYDGAARQAAFDTGGRLVILFAGDLYLNRDPLPFLHAVERLVSRPDVDASRVSVTFMGRRSEQANGSIASWLESCSSGPSVEFIPPQPPNVVAEVAARSTVLLNLAQHQPMSVPAKTFEHLASGRENLLLCENDSETALLVANVPGVVQVDPADADALDQALFDLYDRHVNQGRLQAPSEQDAALYSRDAAHDAFWRVIQAVVAFDVRGETKVSTC